MLDLSIKRGLSLNRNEVLKAIVVHDDIILNIIYYLKFVKFKSYTLKKEQYGIYYHGISYIYGVELELFKKVIHLCLELFSLGQEEIKLTRDDCAKKENIITELTDLEKMISEALKKNLIIMHYGV